VCVSVHSGGYHAAASCLRGGGLDVRETYLFDALYSKIETFRDWVTSRKGASVHRRDKLVSFFADGTPTDANNSALRAQLDHAGVLTASELPGERASCRARSFRTPRPSSCARASIIPT